MAQQKRVLEGIGEVTFQKRRGTRSVRIHIHGSSVKVTMPHWFTYAAAEKFAQKRASWIQEHRKERALLVDGASFGKQHTISVAKGKELRTRIHNQTLHVQLPNNTDITNERVQSRINTAAERALNLESAELITPRVQDLALEHGFEYKSIGFKKLKTRWGSCDNQNNLVFNIFLVQLPWELIDYVIIHELAHTKHHNHSTKFWQAVAHVTPNYKALRKTLHQYQSHVIVN